MSPPKRQSNPKKLLNNWGEAVVRDLRTNHPEKARELEREGRLYALAHQRQLEAQEQVARLTAAGVAPDLAYEQVAPEVLFPESALLDQEADQQSPEPVELPAVDPSLQAFLSPEARADDRPPGQPSRSPSQSPPNLPGNTNRPPAPNNRPNP